MQSIILPSFWQPLRGFLILLSFAATLAATSLTLLGACGPQLQCASTEGRRLAEAIGAHLSDLWGRDRAAWEARAISVARTHGRSLLYCIADTLEGDAARLLLPGQAPALRRLAAGL